MKKFKFTLQHTLNKARAGEFTTPHGRVETPAFMSVGTRASVKALDAEDIKKTKAQIVLSNTYHLYLKPGEKIIAEQGGIQKFTTWGGPMITDSGGFQVFSLGLQQEQVANNRKNKTQPQAKISDKGVEFKSHLDGSKHFFTPEKSIEIQRQLGADIIMAFDECTPDEATEKYAREALDRTHNWARQCKDYWDKQGRLSAQGHYQALFGIVQGGLHQDLRRESAQTIVGLDFDGVAVGGETIGYNMEGTAQVMDWIEDLLPADKPRYAMGVGRDPQDIVDAVLMGFDMFDCVGPTRLARNGALYHGHLDTSTQPWQFVSQYKKGRLNIGNAQFKHDKQVIQEDCDCHTCRSGYSRAYLHHLYKTQELSYYRLASIHNIRTMIRLTEELRSQIIHADRSRSTAHAQKKKK